MVANNHFGFLRVAAAVPRLRVADCAHNAVHILALLERAENKGVAVVVFPELSLTGYTCADLFQQQALLRAATDALAGLIDETGYGGYGGLCAVGL
ncbi:MAG: NAD(+) synthase, partial [Planctomycetes bacterium]|nr:NAD(+) synthase [Planctomycetota bacterium]